VSDQAESTGPEQIATADVSAPIIPAAADPQQTPQPTPRINIKSQTPLDREGDVGPRQNSRQRRPETIDAWEDRTLSTIFRITLKEDQKDGVQLSHLPGVKAELEAAGSPLRISLDVLEQAILEAASQTPNGKPLEYLLGCWKRVSKLWRSTRTGKADDPKFNIVKEARRLCMSYCIFAATIPEMFGLETSDKNPLVEHLLCDPDRDTGICHEFLQEAVARFPDDESIKNALVQAMEQLSRDLSNLSMNDDYKPYVMALRNFVRHPPLVEALTQSSEFLPEDCEAETIETHTLLGPFFRISPLTADVALGYFTGFRARDDNFVRTSQHALRMTLQTHQDDLVDITDKIVRSAKVSRERMLDWFAFVVNKNHKRRATFVDEDAVSSDGFMINVTAILDRLSEPIVDPTFARIEKIDVNYLRKSPRVEINDETKINADQKTSDEFYGNHLGPRENHFMTEIFFLTLAAHHYGKEAANTKLSDLQRQINHLEKQVEQFEKERPKFANVSKVPRFHEHHWLTGVESHTASFVRTGLEKIPRPDRERSLRDASSAGSTA
jgi:ubiquitin conjugation factor E4 B